MRSRDGEKERRVIEMAKQLVVTHGFDGFSMNKLARSCGISVATLYIYYKDKDDLFRTIGAEIGQRFFDATLADFSPDMPFRQGLRRQWENRIAFALDHPLDVSFYEILRQSPYSEYIDHRRLGRFKETMAAFFQTAIDRRELIPLPSETFWAIAYGPLYTLLNFQRDGRTMGGLPFNLEQRHIDDALDAILKALTP